MAIELGAAPDEITTAAMSWLVRFYPAVSVDVSDTTITLDCGDLSAKQLDAIWRATLLNERRHVAAQSQRKAVLERLTQ